MSVRKEIGSAVVDVVIAAAMLIFVILPVFSVVMEKYVLLEKARMIRDSVDVTNISAYNALFAGNLGRVYVNVDHTEALEIFKELLSANLKLDDELNPKEGSIVEGRVEVRSLEIYASGFPVICPGGKTIIKPSIHSSINIPIQPALYRRVVLALLGKNSIDVVVHVDSEIPVNN